MQNLSSLMPTIIIVSLVIFLLNSILSDGVFKKTVNFICGVLITVIFMQPIVNVGEEIVLSLSNHNQQIDYDYYSIGIKMQIKQYDCFENANVMAYCNHNSIDKIHITVKKSDCINSLSFERNKKSVVNLLKYVYKLNENDIKIEVV